MKKTIEFDETCSSCSGTGLYVGMGERDGAAVVCSRCKGTGCHHFKHDYEEFSKRNERKDIKHVYEMNPGICIGLGRGHRFEDFGGITHSAWREGGEFGPGSENRNFICPAWWYQHSDYEKKPTWDKCIACGSFSGCPHFSRKSECWERWDSEQK